MPARRERLLEVSDLRVGWLDFFSIQGCRWGELVSQRNSQLGRVMPRTHRVVYELEFLEAAGPCLDGLSPERRPKFEEAVATKRREIGRHVWNAVWNGPEIERFLSSSPTPLLGGRLAAREASARLEAAVAAAFDSPADGEALAVALGELHRAAGAGPLLHDLARARDALEAVASQLEGLAPASCDTRSRRLVGLFAERYVPTLEPLLAELDREARAVLASLAGVYRRTRRLSGEPVPALERYYARVLRADGDALGPRFRAASQRHARAWAPLLAACRLAGPGMGSARIEAHAVDRDARRPRLFQGAVDAGPGLLERRLGEREHEGDQARRDQPQHRKSLAERHGDNLRRGVSPLAATLEVKQITLPAGRGPIAGPARRLRARSLPARRDLAAVLPAITPFRGEAR